MPHAFTGRRDRGHAWRWLVAFALLLVCSIAQAQTLVAIPALTGPVVDTTATLDEAASQHLAEQALALQQRKGAQLQVLVVNTTQPEDIAQYAQRVFDAWQLGRKGVDDGVLLVVAVEDRRVRIHTGYGLEGAIPDATAEQVIQDYLLPKFRDDDYAGGITDGAAALVALIEGEPLPEVDTSLPTAMKVILALFALPFIAIPIAGMVAAWKSGPLAFFGRWAFVLVALGLFYQFVMVPNWNLEPDGELWIPVTLITYLITTFTFFTALGGSGGSGSGSSSRSSSSSSSSSSWSGGGGRSGGGGASGGW